MSWDLTTEDSRGRPDTSTTRRHECRRAENTAVWVKKNGRPLLEAACRMKSPSGIPPPLEELLAGIRTVQQGEIVGGILRLMGRNTSTALQYLP